MIKDWLMFSYFFIYLPFCLQYTYSIWERDTIYSRVFQSILPFFSLIKSLSSLLWKWFECLYLLKSMIPRPCRETVSFYYKLVTTVDFINLKQTKCEGYLLLGRLNAFWKISQSALFCNQIVLTNMLLGSTIFTFFLRQEIVSLILPNKTFV